MTERRPESTTRELLLRLHDGEQDALEALLERHLPWIQRQVQSHLTPLLRRKGDTHDYLNDVVERILRHGPRFVVRDDEKFRALLSVIVVNVLRDGVDYLRAERRRTDREVPMGSHSVVDLDHRQMRAATRPDDRAAREEEREWVRLAMQLMSARDREVLVLRDYEKLSFPEIGARLDLGEDAARKRYDRAFERLARKVNSLQLGVIDVPALAQLVADHEADADDGGVDRGDAAC